jgi:hypothetical protein
MSHSVLTPHSISTTFKQSINQQYPRITLLRAIRLATPAFLCILSAFDPQMGSVQHQMS